MNRGVNTSPNLTYDDVAEDLCSIRSLFLMFASARDATQHGGDSVLDNHVGLVSDGFMSGGEKFQNSCLRYRELGTATAPLKAMAADTGKPDGHLLPLMIIDCL